MAKKTTVKKVTTAATKKKTKVVTKAKAAAADTENIEPSVETSGKDIKPTKETTKESLEIKKLMCTKTRMMKYILLARW